jgi:hypothetical protein
MGEKHWLVLTAQKQQRIQLLKTPKVFGKVP